MIFLHVPEYKPSDKNETEPINGNSTTTTSATTESSTTTIKTAAETTTLKTVPRKDVFDELDSLTAPIPAKPQFPQKKISKFPPKNRVPLLKRPPILLPKPQARQTTPKTLLTPQTTTVSTTLSTTESTTLPTTTLRALPRESTTFTAPIQALVQKYQEKVHVVNQPTYPPPVLQAIQKNFEHKKNIFEQFVTFDETDKAFVPNKEVVNSDWSIDNTPKISYETDESSLSDKILVYQTLPTTTIKSSSIPQATTPSSNIQSNRRLSAPTFPNERNAEGGFRPIITPPN